jgi:hypothetical protein
LIASGGLGIARNVYTGGDVVVQATTASTTSLTGALLTAGGLGVKLNANVGGMLKVAGQVVALATTQSTGSSIGSLLVMGGLGVAKNTHIGGTLTVAGATTLSGAATMSDTTGSTSTTIGSLILAGGLGVAQNVYTGGDVVVQATTASTTSLTGALLTAGGLGVKLNANVGGTLTVAQAVTATATTDSTTSTTGSLIVSGGLGVSKHVFVGHAAFGSLSGSDLFVAQASKFTTTNYALYQSAAGATKVNAVAGQTVTLANSNANVLTATDTGSGRIGILTSTPTMELDVNGGVQGTVAYQSASDKRWKKNIAPLQNSLAKVLNLTGVSCSPPPPPPTVAAASAARSRRRLTCSVSRLRLQVSYDWRADEFPLKRFEDNAQLGLIAQDAESVVPEIVVTDPQGWKSVQYSKLIPVLIEALREQQDQIDSLELKLKQDNANLSRRLRALNA